MSLFGVGSMEFLLILVIALIVAGPKRMLQWAYYMGRVMGQIRVMWGQVMESIQAELDEAGVDIKLPKQLNRGEINRTAGQILKPFSDQVKAAETEYRQKIKAAEDEYKREIKEIDDSIRETGEETPATPAQDDGTAVEKQTPASNTDLGTWSGQSPKDG